MASKGISASPPAVAPCWRDPDGSSDGVHPERRSKSGGRLRVLLYEPIPLFAEALSLFLATQSDLEALGVSDLAEFTASLAGAALVVLSVHTWGPQVKTVIRRVRERSTAPLVVLGPEHRPGSMALSVGKDADAYVCERSTAGALLDAIRTAHQWTPPRGSDRSPLRSADATSEGALLTPREREVISLVAEDLTAHRIASELGVSERTVQSHLQHAYKKLGVHGRVGAVEAARSKGLLGRRPVTVAVVS
jgi:DNA-binding NarL/FixJ family response regulator